MKNLHYILLTLVLFSCAKDANDFSDCENTLRVIDNDLSMLCQVQSRVHSYLNPDDMQIRNWAIAFDLNSNISSLVWDEDGLIIDGLSRENIRVNVIFEEGRLWNVIISASMGYECSFNESGQLEAVSITEYTEDGLMGSGKIEYEAPCGLSIKGDFSIN